MAGNFNAFDTFNSARQASYDGLNQVRQDQGRMQAGKAMQSGDYTGAAGALYGAGDLQAGMQVQQGQQNQQDHEFERQRLAHQDKMKQAEQVFGYMKQAGSALLEIPAPIGPDGKPDLTARRQAYLNSVAPQLSQFQLPPEAIQQGADHLDDMSLRALGGQIDNHLQVINRGGGGYDVVDQRTGNAVRSVEPTQKPIIVGNGGVALDPDTGLPMYTNPKSFAPQRPRSGGGGSSGGRGRAPAAPAKTVGGRTYYQVNGEWYDNPEGR